MIIINLISCFTDIFINNIYIYIKLNKTYNYKIISFVLYL